MPSLPIGDGPAFQGLRERVQTALRLNSEYPSVEFKAGADWETHKIAIIKSVLAMSNLRDGGLIVVGQPQDQSTAPGVTEADLLSYDPDIMRDQFDQYASPRAAVNMVHFDIDGIAYVAIEVSEFEELPVICKKAYDPHLKRGGVYIRPFTGRPRSTIVQSADEMRSVLDLAIDKGIALFEATAERRGFERIPTDSAAYAAELGDLEDG